MDNKKSFFAQFWGFWWRHRWLGLGLVGIASAIIEFIEVVSQPPSINEPEHILEIMLHGIILPLLLFALHQTETKKNDAINALSLIDAFVHQLNSAKKWEELIEIIVQFPRNILPLAGISLWIYDPETNRLNLETVHNFDSEVQPTETMSSLEVGTIHCFHSEVEKNSGLMLCSCSLQPQNSAAHDFQRYCLPLPNAKLTIGLIHIYLPKSYKLLDDQKNLLNRIVPEVVLSINKFLLQRVNKLQKEAIKTERQRMASDLHDTLGQDIAYLRTKIDQLATNNHLQENPGVAKELQQMSAVAADANKTIRSMLSATHSASKASLDTRLLAYANSIGERAGFKVANHIEGSATDLPSQMQFQIFLIFREILANIEKHALAQNVNINLSWNEPELLTISISDDGRGFQTDTLDQDEHFGLSIIKARTHEMNGNFSVTSIPNSGTQISIRLPLPTQTLEV